MPHGWAWRYAWNEGYIERQIKHPLGVGKVFLAVNQIDSELWKVNFMDFELGFFDSQSWKFSPAVENPFTLN